MIVNINADKAVQVAKLNCLTFVTVQVTSAVTARFAGNNTDLERPGPGGTLDGIQVNLASGITSFWWVGELWVIANGPPPVNDSVVVIIPAQSAPSNVQ